MFIFIFFSACVKTDLTNQFYWARHTAHKAWGFGDGQEIILCCRVERLARRDSDGEYKLKFNVAKKKKKKKGGHLVKFVR